MTYPKVRIEVAQANTADPWWRANCYVDSDLLVGKGATTRSLAVNLCASYALSEVRAVFLEAGMDWYGQDAFEALGDARDAALAPPEPKEHPAIAHVRNGGLAQRSDVDSGKAYPYVGPEDADALTSWPDDALDRMTLWVPKP